MPTFETPTVNSWSLADGARTPDERRFWSHFGLQPRGRSVLKVGGSWTAVTRPTTTQITAAGTIVDPNGETVPAWFDGGHVHPVTAAVGAELTAAGFTVT